MIHPDTHPGEAIRCQLPNEIFKTYFQNIIIFLIFILKEIVFLIRAKLGYFYPDNFIQFSIIITLFLYFNWAEEYSNSR
jgi:hypothetical protein